MSAPSVPTGNRTLTKAPAIPRPVREQTRPSFQPTTSLQPQSSVLEQALQSPGQSLELDVRRSLESRFSHDFSQVRIHSDEQAGAAARELNAAAFTLNQDIFFAAGQYQPRTPAGLWLLAHEITHTLQQRGTATPTISTAAPIALPTALEREAAIAATQVVLGQPIPAGAVSIATPEAQGIIARQPAIAPVEVVDPARLIDFLVNTVLAQLRRDPDDRSGTIRRQIAQMTETTRTAVLDRLRDRLPQAEWQQLSTLLDESAPAAAEGVTAPSEAEVVPEARDAATPPESAQAQPPETVSETEPEALAEETSLQQEPTEAEGAEETPAAEAAPEGPIAPAVEPTSTDASPSGEPESPQLNEAEAEAAAESPQTESPQTAPAAEASGIRGTAVAATGGGGSDAATANLTIFEQLEARVEETHPEPNPSAPADTVALSKPATTHLDESPAAAPETATSTFPEPETDSATPTALATEEDTEESSNAAEAESVPDTDAPDTDAASAPPEPDPADIPASGSLPDSPSDSGEAPVSGIDTATPADLPESAPPAPEEPEPTAAEPVVTSSAQAPAASLATISPPEETLATEAVASETEPMANDPAAIAVDSTAPELATNEGSAAEEAMAAGPDGATVEGPDGAVADAPTAEGADPEGQACPAEGLGSGETAAAEGVAPSGDGGGAAISEEPPPTALDVAQSDPVEAMGSVANLPPAQLQPALANVEQAASGAVANQESDLATHPPELEQAAIQPRGPIPTVPEAPGDRPLQPVATGQPTAAPAPPAAPVAPPPVSQPAPRVSGTAQQQLSPNDVQQVQSAVQNLPTTDPALNLQIAPAPVLTLEGNADPARTQDQSDRLATSTQEAHTRARQDAARPVGENDIQPTVAAETLRPEATAGGPETATQSGSTAGGAVDPAESVIAQEQSGPEIRASAAQAQQEMVAKKQEQQTQASEAQAESQQRIDQEIQRNTEQQAAERQQAQQAVQEQRQQMSQEQQQLVDRSRTEAGTAGQQGNADISRERQAGDRLAATHVRQGNAEISIARRNAETRAGQERQRAQRESGGVLGWLASTIRSFFEGIWRGLRAIFDAARRVVQEAFERVGRLVQAALDQALQQITAIVQRVVSALVAIADWLFPGLRSLLEAAWNHMRELVQAAIAAVQRLANALRQAFLDALNWVAQRLREGLALLRRAWNAAVNAVRAALQRAIEAARSALQSLAAFAELVQDIAANPLRWLRNLGASAVDGIRNHLWRSLTTAVRNWFNSKVEEFLSIGSLIQVLIRGCISFGQIASMAWQAILASLPMMVIQMLIERLVSLLVPAAAAVMLIIQGLQAAWGAMSRIIAAVQAFVAFLRAVRTGSAGPQFANLLATAATAVIDFVANFLITRLASGLRGVGSRLRGIAQRLQRFFGAARRAGGGVMRTVRRVGAAIARGARTAVRTVVRGGRAAGRAIAGVARRGARALGGAARRAGRALSRTRIGRAVVSGARRGVAAFRRGVQAGRQQFQRLRERFRQRQQRRRQQRQRNAQERLQRAVTAIRPPLEQMLEKGVSRAFLWIRLQIWRGRYLLRSLNLQRDGTVIARVNPTRPAAQTHRLTAREIGTAIEPILAEAERRFLQRLLDEEYARNPNQGVQAAINEIANSRAVASASSVPIDIDVSRRLQSRAVQQAALRQVRALTPPVTNVLIRFGPDAVLDLTRGRHSGDYRGYYVQRAGTTRNTGLPPGTSYPALLQTVKFFSRSYGLSPTEVMRAVRSPSASIMRENVRRLRAQVPIGRKGEFDTTLAPKIRMIGFLTQSIEAARGPGMGAATALAYTVSTSPERLLGRGTEHSVTEGRFAPLTPEGATGAIETRFATGTGTLNSHQSRTENIRHQRIGHIFNRLKRAIEHHEIRGLARSQRRAIQALVEAFRQWLRGQERNTTTPDQIEQLTRSITLFLERYHGR